jgi:hypothetical protein
MYLVGYSWLRNCPTCLNQRVTNWYYMGQGYPRRVTKRLETWPMMDHQTWEQGKAQMFGIAQPGSI